MVHFDSEKGFISEEMAISGFQTQIAEQALQINTLQEAWDEAAAAMLRLRTEDEGWNLYGGQDPTTDGFTLDITQKLAKKAQVQATGNPLLKRGFELRYTNVFSKEFTIKVDDGEKIKPRYQAKIDNPTVREVLFTNEGHEMLEKTLYDTGNLFIIYDRTNGDITRVPFSQITNRAVDPVDNTRTAYYLRSYSRAEFDGRTTNVVEWVPTVEWKERGLDNVDEIAHHPVNHDHVIIDQKVNVPTNGRWGIPDCFAAMPYAWGYSEYIRDAASLLKAMQMVAWRVVGKSKTQAQNAGVQLSQVRKQPGVVSTTAGTELTAMPKAGQVDMNDGLALAAMAASALGVPVTALLANSSVAGSFGAAATLDGPTVAVARERQKRWARFYERVFTAMGIKGLSIEFPKITEDPIHRQVQSLATGRATGAIWADEYRAAFLEATDAPNLHDLPPDVEEYAQAQNAVQFLQMMENAQQAEADREQAEKIAASNPQSSVGNSGVAGKLSDVDNGNRKQDTKPGTGSQTNLAG